MIDPELAAKLDEISAKAEKAYQSAEKVRRYLFWTGVITAALIVLPAIGLLFAIPQFVSSYTTTLQSVGL
ncbi:hypothetical protein HY972_02195 [Candidatus Kaiserbacteria bacterium]|nr:hypothetical protein [Candidatus Kaiserbacteria bacterium]